MNDRALGLRVYKRSARNLILLWNRKDGVPVTSISLSYKKLGDSGSKQKSIEVPATCVSVDEPLHSEEETPKSISENTIICIVREAEAGIDPKELYYVTVKYGPYSEGLRVTAAGIFPSHEKEERAKNIHLYGWDDEGQLWRKLNAVKGPDNRWYLGTISMEASEE